MVAQAGNCLGPGLAVLTWRKGPAPDLPAGVFTTITCADDRGRAHEYELADSTVELGISEGTRKGQTVTLRQVTRLVPVRAGATRQIHALTCRDDLPPGEVCWRLSSRWREENYFRYARTRFALDALGSYAAAPDDPGATRSNPAQTLHKRSPYVGSPAVTVTGRLMRGAGTGPRAGRPCPAP